MAGKVMLSRAFRLHFETFCRLRATDRTRHVVASWGRVPRSTYSDQAEYSSDDLEEFDEESRHISRLPNELRDRMNHVLSPPSTNHHDMIAIKDPLSYKRQLYAKYGEASGVNPGIMWPSKEELEEIIEDEKEWEPTLQELWGNAAAEKQEEAQRRREKQERVESQMKKMPEIIEKFRARVRKEKEADQAGEAKKKAMLLEAREYFGYHIDPRDPRYIDMQERKEEEQKKARKKKRQAEKEARMAGLLNISAPTSAPSMAKLLGRNEEEQTDGRKNPKKS